MIDISEIILFLQILFIYNYIHLYNCGYSHGLFGFASHN